MTRIAIVEDEAAVREQANCWTKWRLNLSGCFSRAEHCMKIRNKKKWNRFPDNIPPDVPEEEDFGVEYVIQYLLPNGKTQTTIAEWLPEKSWNCIYPVLAWHEYAPVSAYDPPVLHMKTRT